MRLCSLNELKEKEIINVCNGKRLGYISNVEIELPCGEIRAIHVPIQNKCFSFGKSEQIVIPWSGIEKIGEDTILVRLEHNPLPKGGCENC